MDRRTLFRTAGETVAGRAVTPSRPNSRSRVGVSESSKATVACNDAAPSRPNSSCSATPLAHGKAVAIMAECPRPKGVESPTIRAKCVGPHQNQLERRQSGDVGVSDRACKSKGCYRPAHGTHDNCCRSCALQGPTKHSLRCTRVHNAYRAENPLPTEWRAITLRQLLVVQAEMQTCCVEENWTAKDGSALMPQDVNLYHLNEYFILPRTVPDGIWIHGLDCSRFLPGAIISQLCSQGKGSILQVRDIDHVHVRVTAGRFVPGTADQFRIDGVAAEASSEGIGVQVCPVTHRSYVGLITPEAQRPAFFISHWWGEPVMDFVKCVEEHARVRGLSKDSPYWCCAYANDQHDLSSELSMDPRKSSFFRALSDATCKGVLLILNEGHESKDWGHVSAGVPFSRVWCAFELFIALRGDSLNSSEDAKEAGGFTPKQLLLDIATTSAGRARLLTEGLTPQEILREQGAVAAGQRLKMEREIDFPLQVIEAGLRVRLESAQASQERDRRCILNCLAGARDLEAVPPTSHPRYDAANARLRSILALAAWPQATARGLLAPLRLPQALQCDTLCKKISLALPAINGDYECELATGALQAVADGLPPLLEELELVLSPSESFSDARLASLFPKLQVNAGDDFQEPCAHVTDASSAFRSRGLGRTSGSHLRSLHLVLRETGVGDEFLEAFSTCLLNGGLPTLEVLHLRLSRTAVGTSGLANLTRGLSSQSTLRRLTLRLDYCDGLGDAFLEELGKCLAQTRSMSAFKMSCAGCADVSNTGILGLLQRLAAIVYRLDHLELEFVNTQASREFWRVSRRDVKKRFPRSFGGGGQSSSVATLDSKTSG